MGGEDAELFFFLQKNLEVMYYPKTSILPYLFFLYDVFSETSVQYQF